MKTVLIITYAYPPFVSTASRRSGCMAKYLPHHGWRPLVAAAGGSDGASPSQCPGGQRHDADFVQGLPRDAFVAAVPDSSLRPRGFLGAQVARVVKFFWPHTYPARWTRQMRRRLPQVFRANRIDAVWASSIPPAVHTLADFCSGSFGVPWIADFRDVVGQHGARGPAHRLFLRRAVGLERRIVRSAAAITTVSEGLAEMLRERHGREIHVVPNGFDPDDLAEREVVRPPKFNIVFTGLMLPGISARPALDALALLIDDGSVREADVVVEFYGHTPERVFETMLAGYRYPGIVRVHPSVSGRACAEVCRSSAILLQPGWAGCKGILTGKIFEYLAAQRPILSAPGDGDCIDRLLRETNAGVSCYSQEGTAAQLLAWYREWQATDTVAYRGKLDAIMKYSRKRQAGHLAALLDGIVPDGPGQPARGTSVRAVASVGSEPDRAVTMQPAEQESRQ